LKEYVYNTVFCQAQDIVHETDVQYICIICVVAHTHYCTTEDIISQNLQMNLSYVSKT